MEERKFKFAYRKKMYLNVVTPRDSYHLYTYKMMTVKCLGTKGNLEKEIERINWIGGNTNDDSKIDSQ